MSTVTFMIEGNEDEIKEAVSALLTAGRDLCDQGFQIGTYEIGPEGSTMTLAGRSVTGS